MNSDDWIVHTDITPLLGIGALENSALWKAAQKDARNIRVLGDDTLFSLYGGSLQIINPGGYGIVLKGKRVDGDKKDIVVKIFFNVVPKIQDPRETKDFVAEEVAPLLYLRKVNGGKCRDDLPCFIRVFKARLGARYMVDINAYLKSRSNDNTFNNEDSFYCIESRLEPGDELFSVIFEKSKTVVGLERSVIWNAEFMAAILEPLVFLHNNGIYHRDLKPENIIVREYSKNAKPEIVLLDFGLACATSECGSVVTGTEDYIDPSAFRMSNEVLRKEETRDKLDCYACGVIVWEWMTATNQRTLISVTKGWSVADQQAMMKKDEDAFNAINLFITKQGAIWDIIQKMVKQPIGERITTAQAFKLASELAKK
jgi:serine/threonine protein kinase